MQGEMFASTVRYNVNSKRLSQKKECRLYIVIVYGGDQDVVSVIITKPEVNIFPMLTRVTKDVYKPQRNVARVDPDHRRRQ